VKRWGALVLLLSAALGHAEGRTPVLVELFTSEGCSSCPQADEALESLARAQPIAGAEIVPLELHVDYWNTLGWTDPFSSPEATTRQEAYATAGVAPGYGGQLFTPQMVVDGTRSFVGDRALAIQAVTQALARPKRPLHAQLRAAPGGVDVELQVGAGEERGAGLWLVVTESGLSSRVTRGENKGRTLLHAPVTRTFERVAVVPPGGWTGTVRLPIAPAWRRDALRVVAFAQDIGTGRVVAVVTAPVPNAAPAAALPH
jgi:hypothetical protein